MRSFIVVICECRSYRQAFPTDLHKRLEPRLPKGITILSVLYPTYKSVRPISEATSHFLDW